MKQTHGFVVPFKDSCVSFPKLIISLHTQISGGKQCIICENEFDSVCAAQNHMRDKGHCRVDLGSGVLANREVYNFLGKNILKMRQIIVRYRKFVIGRLEMKNPHLVDLLLGGKLEAMVAEHGLEEEVSRIEQFESEFGDSELFDVLGVGSFGFGEEEVAGSSDKILEDLVLGDVRAGEGPENLESFEIAEFSRIEKDSDSSFQHLSELEESGIGPIEPEAGKDSFSVVDVTEEVTKEETDPKTPDVSNFLNQTHYSERIYPLTSLIREFFESAKSTLKTESENQDPSRAQTKYNIRFLETDLDLEAPINFASLILHQLGYLNKHGELVIGDRVLGHRKYRRYYAQRVGSLAVWGPKHAQLQSGSERVMARSLQSSHSESSVRSFNSTSSQRSSTSTQSVSDRGVNRAVAKQKRRANQKRIKLGLGKRVGTQGKGTTQSKSKYKF